MESHRVEEGRSPERAVPRRRRFEELLRGGPTRPKRERAPPRGRTSAVRGGVFAGADAREVARSSETRCAARTAIDAGARARLEQGAFAGAEATGRLCERALALLVTARRHEAEASPSGHTPPLLRGAEAGPMRVPAAEATTSPPLGSGAGPGAAQAAGATEAAERALALVERVEVFLRSGRPALALTLRGEAAGNVEVRRVARGTVSLHFASERPPSATELVAIRAAVHGRGLSIESVELVRLSPSHQGAPMVV